MDFKDSIKQLAERTDSLKNNLHTEEATKTALIMPFLSTLGYDVFNPLEVVPEFTCDIGTKKGEKIDYAIMKDGEPVIIVECKHWNHDLNLYDNQLLRYFHVSNAKIGILTNGIIYQFYTDLVAPNKMDDRPFLEINMLDLKDAQVEELKKFHKSYFDIGAILSAASVMKYTNEIKAIIASEFAAPSPDFVKYFGKKIYDGVFTSKLTDFLTPLVKRSLSAYVNEIISDRLNAAIQNEDNKQADNNVTEQNVQEEEAKIKTTVEEMEAFYIVKAILRKSIPLDRVTYRDSQSYFTIFIDDNNRKPVCRFYFNSETNKKIVFLDENKKEVHHKISSLDEIYDYSEDLINAIKKFL